MPQTKLYNFTANYQNKREYHSLKREIFTQGIYEPSLEIGNSNLIILDIGAHIGLSTLYFKWLYPNAKIIAIEPNPENFAILEQNIFENNLEDIETYNLALDTKEGKAQLYVDKDDEWQSNSSLLENSWTGEEKTKAIVVKTQTLSYFIDLIFEQSNSLAILKMDIEGLESEILFSAGEKLKVFNELLIEFHPTGKQNINKLIKHLESLNFKVNLEKKNKEVKDRYHRGLTIIKAINIAEII
ncbi:MAG: FkbM family methyltransferase [Patescibacteria group bacterium]